MQNKILFISSGISKMVENGIAGGEMRLAEIMRGFIKSGWEVFMLTNGGGEFFCKIFELYGVKYYNFNIKDGKNRWGYIISTIKIFFRLPEELKTFKGYIYTANELLFDVAPAVKIKWSNKNKWAAIVHWMPPLKFWRREKSNVIVSFLFMVCERISVFMIKHFANLALAVSKSTKDQLLRSGLKKDMVISVNCGVNLQAIVDITKDVRNKKYDAVFMKRIQAVKGVFDLIDIWELAVKHKPNIKLAIVGGGIDNDAVNKMIKEKGLADNINFFWAYFRF